MRTTIVDTDSGHCATCRYKIIRVLIITVVLLLWTVDRPTIFLRNLFFGLGFLPSSLAGHAARAPAPAPCAPAGGRQTEGG